MTELILSLLALFVTCAHLWILFKVARFHVNRLRVKFHIMRYTDYNYCMCGDSMDSHGFGSGHAPVSTRDYHMQDVYKLRIR